MGVVEKGQQKHCTNTHDDEKRGKANGSLKQETFEAVQFPTRGSDKEAIHG
jgi:hypothetical protein